jgi:aldose 1-epimerase
MPMKTSETTYAVHPNGKKVMGYAVGNSRGMSFKAISYGATLTSVKVPDRTGSPMEMILGFGTLEEYMANPFFIGATIGRFANRIEGGRFTLDGKTYTLECNDVKPSARNHLHGGMKGFDKVLWRGKPFRSKDSAGIRFSYASPDGEEGYPGALKATAAYSLTESNELVFEYWATADEPTPVNLTNHAYWNISGAGSGTVLSQEMTFACPFYLPVDSAQIPTGEVRETAGTPFDFLKPKQIGRGIAEVPGGYDHCFVLRKPAHSLGLACTVRDPASGRVMEVWTTKPGVLFYSGNYLGGNYFLKHGAICLETLYFPNCVNVEHFPSCILLPGQIYHHKTVHKFMF